MSELLLYGPDASLWEGTQYPCLCHCQIARQPVRPEQGPALWLDEQGLTILHGALSQPFHLTGAMLKSRLQGASLLRQACGVGRGASTVLDACAGYGLDSLTLAHAGCAVTAVERHPLVWLMLCDYAQRTGYELDARLGDCNTIMSDTSAGWDVVYLDPMFPSRRKKALPNLGLQYLQLICQDDATDLARSLALARDRAGQRVVVKRRTKDPVLEKPAFQLQGQAVRFDIYT